MHHSKLITLFIILTLVFTAIHCKKSSPTEGDPSDLVGNWAAGQNIDGTKMTYTSMGTPPIPVDMIAFQSALNVVLRSDNTYTLTIVVPPLDVNEIEEGKVSYSGNRLTLTADDYPDEAITFEWSLNGDLLTLKSNDAEFDFNFDDVDDPAILDIILRKVD